MMVYPYLPCKSGTERIMTVMPSVSADTGEVVRYAVAIEIYKRGQGSHYVTRSYLPTGMLDEGRAEVESPTASDCVAFTARSVGFYRVITH